MPGHRPTVDLLGNPSDGYRVVGPFADFGHAAARLENVESWITTLHATNDLDT